MILNYQKLIGIEIHLEADGDMLCAFAPQSIELVSTANGSEYAATVEYLDFLPIKMPKRLIFDSETIKNLILTGKCNCPIEMPPPFQRMRLIIPNYNWSILTTNTA